MFYVAQAITVGIAPVAIRQCAAVARGEFVGEEKENYKMSMRRLRQGREGIWIAAMIYNFYHKPSRTKTLNQSFSQKKGCPFARKPEECRGFA
jgi:hypothetical protein